MTPQFVGVKNRPDMDMKGGGGGGVASRVHFYPCLLGLKYVQVLHNRHTEMLILLKLNLSPLWF